MQHKVQKSMLTFRPSILQALEHSFEYVKEDKRLGFCFALELSIRLDSPLISFVQLQT